MDALLAAAVTAMVLVDLASPTDAVGVRRTDALAVVLSLLQTLPLAFRRRAPLATFILILLGVSVYYPLGYEVTDGTLATFVGVYTVAHFVLTRTKLGRYTYAIGGNEEAAVFSGVRVDRVVIGAFSLSGISFIKMIGIVLVITILIDATVPLAQRDFPIVFSTGDKVVNVFLLGSLPVLAVVVLGALRASPAVKSALAGRIRSS